MRSTVVWFFFAVLPIAGAFEALQASDAEAVPPGYKTGYHIVRPGENLRRITRNYLGSEELWESNWRLNPDLENPDVIRPSRRLKVLLQPENAVPTAQVVSIAGTVQQRPDPISWTTAQRLDLLVESDGIQTEERSSTGLLFADGTRLVLTEDSTVFLKVAGRTLRGIETRSVEIVEGQADLAGSDAGSTGASPEIEFVIGNTTSRPKPGSSGAAEARFRKSEAGSAQLMIYQGASEVSAGGKSVAVEEGMGTSVPVGAAPLPPEKLLPRPAMRQPQPGGALETGSLAFSWEPVPGAAGYSVEVCSDVACEALVRRAVGVTSTSWEAEDLSLGSFNWRVTAVSPSGLDGYPAATRPFSVVPRRAEFEAPTATFSMRGPWVERDLGSATVTYYSAGAEVQVEVSDPSGVRSWQPVIDSEVSTESRLQGIWPHGIHTVAVRGEDELGNSGQTETSISFTVDAEAPTLSWQVGGRELLEEFLGSGALETVEPRWWTKKAKQRNARRARKSRPPEWSLLAWGNQRIEPSATFENQELIEGLYQSYSGLRVTGDNPKVILVAPGIVDPRPADGRRVAEILVLEATDAWAGVEDLTVTTVGSPSTGYRLRAQSRDRLGNTASATWTFDRSAP